MLNQKIQNPKSRRTDDRESISAMSWTRNELKLDEMIEAEPEPEMIEGLPASDALTPADRYL